MLKLFADSVSNTVLSGACQGGPSGCSSGNGVVEFIGNFTHVLIFLIGAISVIMVIIGAFRLVLSSGSPDRVRAGRETVLYALIGLVVAIVGYQAVTFIISKIQG